MVRISFATLIFSVFAFVSCDSGVYTNRWAVHISGGETVAENVAQKYGFRNLGKVCVIIIYYCTCEYYSGKHIWL